MTTPLSRTSRRVRNLLALVLLSVPSCGGGSATNPGPGPGECLRDVDCNDSVDCTDDVCGLSVNGVRKCEHVPRTERCPDGSECLSTSDLGAGCLERVALWCAGRGEGAACTPDDACAQGDGVCQGGRCTFARKECAPSACLVSRGCNAATGRCEYGPEPDGTACDLDGLACSTDECRDGQCRTVADACECTPGRSCPAGKDLCVQPPRCVDGACLYDPVECPAAEPCREFVCDPGIGQCAARPIREDGPCDDGRACTGEDACSDGECAGTPLDCAPGPCRTASCEEPLGCAYGSLTDGTACDDGDLCNGPDTCLEGACVALGPAVSCDDSDECTSDSCWPGDGACVHGIVPDCCGNGLLEDGEQCDPARDASPLCAACAYAFGELTRTGGAPAVAWSDEAGSGLLAWEESDAAAPGGVVLKVARVDVAGRVGPVRDVPEATPGSHSRFYPALAAAPGGRFLLAFYQGKYVGLRLLDADGSPLDAVIVEDASGPSDSPGAVVAVGTLGEAALVAWAVSHTFEDNPWAEVRAAYVVIAGNALLPAPAIQVAGDPENHVKVYLGDACMGPDGALLVMISRSAGVSELQTVLVDTDGLPLPIYGGEQFPEDLRMRPRCLANADGTYFATWPRVVKEGATQGVEARAARLDATGVIMSQPWPLARSWMVDGQSLDLVYPVASGLARWGEGFAFVSPWLQGATVSYPTALLLRAVSTTGEPGSAEVPVPVDGAPDGFAMSLGVTGGPDGAILMAWQRLLEPDNSLPPAVIRARFLAPP